MSGFDMKKTFGSGSLAGFEIASIFALCFAVVLLFDLTLVAARAVV